MGLRHIFGDTPRMRLADFFLVNQFWDYSLKDIAKTTRISHRTLQEIVPILAKTGIIVYTRTEGKAKMYKFNSRSNIAQGLLSLSIEADIEAGKNVVYNEQHKPLPV